MCTGFLVIVAVVTVLATTSHVAAHDDFDPGYPAFSVNSFDGSAWIAHRFEVAMPRPGPARSSGR